jgi:hypothetical protein
MSLKLEINNQKKNQSPQALPLGFFIAQMEQKV